MIGTNTHTHKPVGHNVTRGNRWETDFRTRRTASSFITRHAINLEHPPLPLFPSPSLSSSFSLSPFPSPPLPPPPPPPPSLPLLLAPRPQRPRLSQQILDSSFLHRCLSHSPSNFALDARNHLCRCFVSASTPSRKHTHVYVRGAVNALGAIPVMEGERGERKEKGGRGKGGRTRRDEQEKGNEERMEDKCVDDDKNKLSSLVF